MPGPPSGEPCIPSATAGFSAQEAAGANKDYLYFLRHVRLDGDAYSVVIPSEDGASSPPQVIRYEQPLPDHNAGTRAAGSDCGGQRAPPSSEEESPWGTSEAPHDVKRKAPDASPGGEVRGGAVPMEEDTPTPVAEPAWYDSPDIDDDYRIFHQHSRVVDDKLVFTMGNYSITIGGHGDAEEDDDIEEEEGEREEEDEEDEDDLPASGQSGEDGIGMEEKDDEEEAIPASVTEDAVDSKVKEEEVSMSKKDDDDVGPGSDLQIVNDLVYYEMKRVEEGENTLNALAIGATNLDPLDKKEASSSKGHLAMPLNASEEYDEYFAMAIDRSPLLKERRTRNKVAYYPWTHEMNKSYFDRYPDLAEQFSLQSNNYPNGLALLRGLFFWLQNVTLEGQFMPWSNAFKKYRVVPFVE